MRRYYASFSVEWLRFFSQRVKFDFPPTNALCAGVPQTNVERWLDFYTYFYELNINFGNFPFNFSLYLDLMKFCLCFFLHRRRPDLRYFRGARKYRASPRNSFSVPTSLSPDLKHYVLRVHPDCLKLLYLFLFFSCTEQTRLKFTQKPRKALEFLKFQWHCTVAGVTIFLLARFEFLRRSLAFSWSQVCYFAH